MKIKKVQLLQIIILLMIILFLSAFVNAAENNKEELISINLREVELESALIMLANTAEKNLICDSKIKGKITVIFNDIKFREALNLITDSFDLEYSYNNNIIYVSTKEKITEKNQSLVSKTYKFNNLSSEKALKVLKENFPEIKLINLNSDGLIVSSSDKKLTEIEKIIKKIDRPQKQVMINARVEEISRTKIKELGINPDELSELKILKSSEGNINKLKASWPDTLKALNEEGLSNILANPSLMTLDRKKAKLIIGDQIPVKLEKVEDDETVSTISYIEGGIVLEFLPRIINKKQLILEIKPSVNSLGQVLAEGLPAVNSRSAETTVMLENGETLAIGGLIKKDELKTVKKIPLIAELPILGHLFRSSEIQDLETELIIFITPQIIENDNNTKTPFKNNNKSTEKEKKFKPLSREELKEILEK